MTVAVVVWLKSGGAYTRGGTKPYGGTVASHAEMLDQQLLYVGALTLVGDDGTEVVIPRDDVARIEVRAE